MSVDFFESYWKDYLEYSASVSFGSTQIKREVDYLGIKPGDTVANVGINWGEPIAYIFEVCPDVGRVVGVDYSPTMIGLSKAVFSYDTSSLEDISRGLSHEARGLLYRLHAQARGFRDQVSFVSCSAEELYREGLVFDKIAATMGLHWLREPKTDAFTSFNKCLREGGTLVFSTSSAFYHVANPARCFINNPYYTTFYEQFEKEFYGNRKRPQDTVIHPNTVKMSLEEVTRIVEEAGFCLESSIEIEIELDAQDIDRALKAGIKFRYGIPWHDEQVRDTIERVMGHVKADIEYESSESRFEICPLFRIRKVRRVG